MGNTVAAAIAAMKGGVDLRTGNENTGVCTAGSVADATPIKADADEVVQWIELVWKQKCGMAQRLWRRRLPMAQRVAAEKASDRRL